MTDWVEPWSWTKNEVITASKLNTLRQAILYLKETTDDYHRTAKPIDHPDGSITPVKLDTINTPSDGQAPVYDGETGRFRWATGLGGVSRLSELIIDVDKDWAGYRIRNLGEPVDTGDALRLPWNHASRHLLGGGDPLSGLSRSQISDFFTSPFWNNIPDKPSTFTPSAHASTHQTGGSDPLTSLDAGVITSGTLGLDRIPSIPPSKLDAVDTPSNGEVPSYNAAQGKFEWVPVAAAGLKKVAEVSVTSNTTQVTITGLGINTDKFYLIIVWIKNPQATAAYIDLCVNGDTTLTNYYGQYLQGAGTEISAGRENRPKFTYAYAGTDTLAWALLIRDPDGYPRWHSADTLHNPSNIRFEMVSSAKTATVTNITEIDIYSETANAIGAGSKIIIYGASG